MVTGFVADIGIWLPYTAIAFWTGSLTMLAETVRAALMMVLELVVLALLRRIHRNRMAEYEFGTGKAEQFANLAIAAAMAVSALLFIEGAWNKFRSPPEAVPVLASLGMALMGFINLLLNGWVAWKVWLAARDGTSVIMTGQMRSRLSKLASSVLVMLALFVSSIDNGGTAGLLADAAGGLFVAIVMLSVAWSMGREALPDLLDRSLSEARQTAINRALAEHFHAYEDLLAVRSRQSGKAIHIEVELAFAPDLPLAEVARRSTALRETVIERIPGAHVLIVPHAA